MLFDNFLCLFRSHLNVSNLFLVLFVDFNNGFVLADTDASGLCNGYLVGNTCFGNAFNKSVQNRTSACSAMNW